MRTIIDVPNEVIETLDRVRAVDKRSRASVIREAIDVYLRGKSEASADAAFGLWKTNPKDGVSYQEELRKDWESR